MRLNEPWTMGEHTIEEIEPADLLGCLSQPALQPLFGPAQSQVLAFVQLQ